MTAGGYLDHLQKFGVHLGLERIRALLKRLGEPQVTFQAVHVAGTNGKGSVCAYLSHILQAAGYRTGRYTSPHLLDWNERIWIGGAFISDGALQACLATVKTAAEHLPKSLGEPTQFEIVTAAAFLYFAQSAVEVAVVEVGLGGRLDATNVFEPPLASVITSVGLDHCEQLGSTLAAIAAEKAGILRSGCPLVCAPLSPEAMQVVTKKALALDVGITLAEPARAVAPGEAQWQGIRYRLPLAGGVQLQNSATALATCQVLRGRGLPIDETSIRAGFENTVWPGRYQRLGERLLLDGAHNEDGAVALRAYLDCLHPKASIRWIVGILESKDAQAVLRALLRPGDTFVAVPIPDARSHPPETLAFMAQTMGLSSIASASGFSEALRLGDTERLTVIAGSLYLAGAVLREWPRLQKR
ncbi:bifunctional folylpolyglutamate synthase/dihydrofolate synthase [Gloeobacter morelensis]|uniref:Bifunctional folylpolyglutamate synthase/dihydrofolate synthase n=1 Tax=Gloeobacter morelensis MG652769 TaxID=2781736 RepID=A0ABY3PSF5_9CYAN|nr:folylpolyglutamate synthase/dihydrofolate synthase family protein [Gloeobacter morelensis]UFP96665.1 bifunctional folylpolyglutamate synthase/dihydrofolate synthase [Gloeobacter morelensis MG652769]